MLNFVGIQSDITEQHHATEARSRSEEQLRALIQSLDEMVFEFDRDGRYLNVWASDETLLVRPREELLGKTLPQALGEERGAAFTKTIRRVIDTRRAESLSYELPIDARPRWFMARISPVVSPDGSCVKACMLARDITAAEELRNALRAAKEEAEQANQAKSDFLSRMSHELRTPLNAILGFAQLLEMGELPDEEKDNAAQILKAGKHLLELINEVLQLASIDAGRQAMSIEPVHVGELLEDARALVRPLAALRRITIDLAAECGDWHLLADRQRVMQVLLNVIANAVKYNRDDGTVTVRCLDAADGRHRIAVTDCGSGIPADKLSRLFIPFERAGAERSGVEGTGLGLALSKKLVELMGGTMGVESEVGRGSTFWLELPATESPRLPVFAPARAELEVRPPARPCKVLYIEDNLSNLRLIHHIFATRPEVKLFSAMQGRLGLELAQQQRPDLILLDLHLPDLPGDEVLGELRAEPATRGIPVVMLSADATERQVERLLAAGACAYLTKPLDVRQFLAVVDAQLAESGTVA